MDAEEREQSRIIDELADLDAPALLSHAQDLVDAMKFECKSGNEDEFWLYQNKPSHSAVSSTPSTTDRRSRRAGRGPLAVRAEDPFLADVGIRREPRHRLNGHID